MIIYNFPNAACSKISITTTATLLTSLINTAGSVSIDFPTDLNSIDLELESGTARFLDDGTTPTSSNGFLISSGETLSLRGVDLRKARIISTSGTISASIRVGRSTMARN